jgi:hypothetical protein
MGIMNIMPVPGTERRREIGIRLALEPGKMTFLCNFLLKQ